MTKRIIPYILFAAGILSACQADYIEPSPVPSGTGEALTLTVTASDIIVTEGVSSRADDSGKATVFDVGGDPTTGLEDIVGLIIIDKDGHLLADNVPYKLFHSVDENGKETKRWWDIDPAKAGDKKRIYYDGTMTDYIVYYPYDESIANLYVGLDNGKKGIKNIEAFRKGIKTLDTYKIRDNQTKEIDYRYSDPMFCTGKIGKDTRQIDAKLQHLRNSFCIDPKVRCTLNNGKEIVFRPKNYILNGYYLPSNIKTYSYETGYDELEIYYKDNKDDYKPLKIHDVDDPDNNMSIVFEAEDGSFRYILPEDENFDPKEYTFKWRYHYRGLTYGGTHDTSKNPGEGRRFLADETIDYGVFKGDKLRVSDYFCKGKDKEGNLMGFPFPWEAVDVLEPEQCLGVIFLLGLTYPKYSDYSSSTDSLSLYENPLDANPDHGYVIALTDAPNENFPLNSTMPQHQWNQGIGKIRINVHYQYSEGIWSGYENCKKIEKFIDDPLNKAGWENFPAAKACKEYGNRSDAFKTPDNTSGWYLPSLRQLVIVSLLNAADQIITKRISVVRGKLAKDCDYKNNVELLYYDGKDFTQYHSGYHWTSSEENENASGSISNNARIVNLWHVGESETKKDKSDTSYVRAILTF